DHDEYQQYLADGLLDDRLQRAFLIRALAARAERDLEPENAHDPVDQTAGDETGTGQPLEAGALRKLFSFYLCVSDRPRLARRMCSHGYLLSAPGRSARTGGRRSWIRATTLARFGACPCGAAGRTTRQHR